jgi:ankyrin repeat protein
VAGFVTAAAQDSSDRYYQAIRENSLASLGALIKAGDVNAGDKRGSTPLMYAAAYGSLDAMKALIAAGTDVNAKNAFDATALMWCASDLEKVRLLVEHGADVNARSKQGRTPLIIAAAHDGASQIVKLLLDKGADPSAHDGGGTTALSAATGANDSASVRLLLDKGVDVNLSGVALGLGIGGQTPLMNAASHGNVEVMKLLMAKKADVNAVGIPELGRVKNGPIALGSMTALLSAVAYGGADAVKLLLDAGADPNAKDVRGMTPLMLAVATDRPDPRVVRMLIEKGANPQIKSKDGESTIDWAKKYKYPPVLAALGIEPAQAATNAAIVTAVDRKLPAPKQAAEKSLALLQRTAGSFFIAGGCVSCHAQNLTGVAVGIARANGFKVDEAAAADHLKSTKLQWAAFEQPFLQRMDPAGAVDNLTYSILQLAAEKAPADRTIDAMIHNVAGEQRKEGNWHLPVVARAPIEDGDFGRTAISLRCLQLYGPAGRKAEFEKRIERAATWLESATPRSTEDRDMQLLGLKWAKGKAPESHLKELLALQHADGGWGQTPELASDAYATGQVLYTLHEINISANDPAYRRAVEYLLRTQLEDGSWHVASRAPKFQPYFQSGFPYDHDQWISSAATGWATIGLVYAAAETTVAEVVGSKKQ